MAKAFPTDNPFLRGYYGPVNAEADAGHLHIRLGLPSTPLLSAAKKINKNI